MAVATRASGRTRTCMKQYMDMDMDMDIGQIMCTPAREEHAHLPGVPLSLLGAQGLKLLPPRPSRLDLRVRRRRHVPRSVRWRWRAFRGRDDECRVSSISSDECRDTRQKARSAALESPERPLTRDLVSVSDGLRRADER